MYLKGKLFILNLGSENIETSRNIVSLCPHSWQKLYGLGHTRIDNIKDTYIKNPDSLLIIHGNKNGSGSRTLGIEEAKISLSHFFNLLKEEGEEHASRKVRARLGNTYLRDNEDDFLLPPHWTVRKLYERWVHECGWIVNSKGGDSSYGKMKCYDPRPTDVLQLSPLDNIP